MRSSPCGIILASDFPTRSAICRRDEPFLAWSPHIQLSYETNPFEASASTCCLRRGGANGSHTRPLAPMGIASGHKGSI